MNIIDSKIDGGKAFDWGRVSSDYAKYRDIYPTVFYEKIVDRSLCIKGQDVLDIGTGTGVIPRNMYKYGATWTATDISENQIEKAKELSTGMEISYFVSSTENIKLQADSFDVITACQCFWYFNHSITSPLLASLLKKGGRLLILYMAWLPLEDRIAGESEKLILKYNPLWTGANETRHPISIPNEVLNNFEIVFHDEYDLQVPFTRDSWHGRMNACRGVGASLSEEEIKSWENEHLALLNKIAPEKFNVLHYAAMTELKVRE